MIVHKNNKQSKKKTENKKKKPVKKKRKKRAVIKKKETIGKQPNRNTCHEILITSQNKKMVSVFTTMYENSANRAFNTIVEENKKVRFPVEYSSRDHKLIPAKYDILLMKTKEYEGEESPLFRNEYGKLVPNISNSKKMVIAKKEKYYFEETFWIYGLNPRSQRKNYNYILNEILLKDLITNNQLKSKYIIKTVLIYKNKLIVENDNGDFNMVICKCENDSARLYTELKKDTDERYIKCIFYSGFTKGVRQERVVERIMEKTGWDRLKVIRKSTRP